MRKYTQVEPLFTILWPSENGCRIFTEATHTSMCVYMCVSLYAYEPYLHFPFEVSFVNAGYICMYVYSYTCIYTHTKTIARLLYTHMCMLRHILACGRKAHDIARCTHTHLYTRGMYVHVYIGVFQELEVRFKIHNTCIHISTHIRDANVTNIRGATVPHVRDANVTE